jgi:capsular polysaccharide biosynthesis protein
MVPSFYSGYVVALGWISNTLPRPAAKRAAALAAINCVSNASSIYASYMYPDSHAPRFGMCFHILLVLFLAIPTNSRLVPAMSVNCATAFVAIVSATVLRFMLVRLNKKLDRGEEVEGAVPGEGSRRGFRFLV